MGYRFFFCTSMSARAALTELFESIKTPETLYNHEKTIHYFGGGQEDFADREHFKKKDFALREHFG